MGNQIQNQKTQTDAAQNCLEIDTSSWKWKLRHRIWDHLEKTNLARFPRPVFHRIPNFVGADQAALQFFAQLPEFLKAKTVKINPDTPQKMCRFLTLENGKRLIVPQPRLRTGFFSRLDPEEIVVHSMKKGSESDKHNSPKSLFQHAATQAGSKELGVPLDLLKMGNIKKLVEEMKRAYLGEVDETGERVRKEEISSKISGISGDVSRVSKEDSSKISGSISEEEQTPASEACDHFQADLIVIGSVAVNPRTGVRVGKGEGFAELEYGVMRMLQCVDEKTLVVTTVHDCQVVEEGVPPPQEASKEVEVKGQGGKSKEAEGNSKVEGEQFKEVEGGEKQTQRGVEGGNSKEKREVEAGNSKEPSPLVAPYDLCVDIIVTPTRVIRVAEPNTYKKPEGIYWNHLPQSKLDQIPILKNFKRELERRLGRKLPTGMEPTVEPVEPGLTK